MAVYPLLPQIATPQDFWSVAKAWPYGWWSWHRHRRCSAILAVASSCTLSRITKTKNIVTSHVCIIRIYNNPLWKADPRCNKVWRWYQIPCESIFPTVKYPSRGISDFGSITRSNNLVSEWPNFVERISFCVYNSLGGTGSMRSICSIHYALNRGHICFNQPNKNIAVDPSFAFWNPSAVKVC